MASKANPVSLTIPLAGRVGAAVLGWLCIEAGPLRAEEVGLLPPVLGASERYLADPRSGTALFGLDPVTYFTEARPRSGLPGVEVVRDGLIWRFASAANRAAFLREPDAFLPRIGGYDPLGATRKVAVAAVPGIYAVRGGRLYLFRNEASRAAFLADPDLADGAERNWPDLRDSLVKD